MAKTQAHFWSTMAAGYDNEFVDPYRADVENPLPDSLKKLAANKKQSVADLGCGTGPLLPMLADSFEEVHAIDFAPEMLKLARKRCREQAHVHFHEAHLTDLSRWRDRWDIAVAINSLVLPNVADLTTALFEIRQGLKKDGTFMAILPSIDAVHYYTMLLLDRELLAGKEREAAAKKAAQLAEHRYYDFAFGQFAYKGLQQHFWHPFEIEHRLKQAGFVRIRLKKVSLSWKQFTGWQDFQDQFEPPWDWFVEAKRGVRG